MKKDKTKPSQERALRSRAETKLKKQKKEDRPAADKDPRRLLHELQVHQVELEMQNEELRRAQQELEASHSKYVDLYDFAPVGYFTLDSRGTILEVNLTGAALLGIERSRLIKKAFSECVAESDRDKFYTHLKEVIFDVNRERCEVQLLKNDGTQFYVQLEGRAKTGNVKISSGCQMIVIDITKRIVTEQEKEKLHVELRQAMDQVKKLSGMLPICSSCKNIRDDHGYWKQIESYITEHSEALFSHSICPECAQKLYPEYYKDDKKRDRQ
jgi:PAS domain S-box-containing protein